MRPFFLCAHLDEYARNLSSINLDVVGQFDGRLQEKFLLNGIGHSFRRPGGKLRGLVYIDLRPQQD